MFKNESNKQYNGDGTYSIDETTPSGTYRVTYSLGGSEISRRLLTSVEKKG